MRSNRPAFAVRPLVALLAGLLLLTPLSPPSEAQTRALEKCFPAVGPAKITVLNSPKLAVSVWDKNEVALVAEAAGRQVRDADVITRTKGERLEIACYPQPAEGAIHITLRVPVGSEVVWKNSSYRVESKETTGAVTFTAQQSFRQNVLHLDVPEDARFDIQEAGNVMRVMENSNQYAMDAHRRWVRFGSGKPEIKVQAGGAQLLITNGGLKRASRPPTRAATAMARTPGALGQAIRRARPDLLRAIPAAPADKAPASRAKPAVGDEESIRLETQLVNLNVSVVDGYGKAVAGLTKDDFRVYEDEALQAVSFFTPEKTPFNLVLLMDLSGSVEEKLGLIKEAALHFLDVIGPEDRVAVVTFATDVQVVSPLTGDREALRRQIRALQTPTGATSVYDALGYTLAAELAGIRRQRNAVILITDGQDSSLLPPRLAAMQKELEQAGFNARNRQTGSLLSFADLVEGVLEADAIVYPVYLRQAVYTGRAVTQTTRELVEMSHRQLQELADVSGGRIFSARQVEDLKGVYEQVAAELRTVYSLAYTPTNTASDGTFRRLRVTVRKPGAVTRSRRGYYAN